MAWLAQRKDKSATSRLMAINRRTVGTIVERVVAERLDAHRLEELYVIGVEAPKMAKVESDTIPAHQRTGSESNPRNSRLLHLRLGGR